MSSTQQTDNKGRTDSVMSHDPLADLDAFAGSSEMIIDQQLSAADEQPQDMTVGEPETALPETALKDSQAPQVVASEAVEETAQPTLASKEEHIEEPAMSESVTPEQGEINLSSSFTIMEVGEWHPKLSACCEAGGPVVLNGGELDQIDGAGIQLLAAFVKEMVHLQLEVSWSDVSESLKEAADVLGLREALCIPADNGE